jgi:hypothetical protein
VLGVCAPDLFLVKLFLLANTVGALTTDLLLWHLLLIMTSTHRPARERRMSPSASEISRIRQSRLPVVLPHLNSKHKRPQFYDEISVSPDFVRLPTRTTHEKTKVT